MRGQASKCLLSLGGRSHGCRLFPPAPTIIREAQRDTSLGGHAIAKGQWLGCAVYSMHRNPKYWQVLLLLALLLLHGFRIHPPQFCEFCGI